MQLFYCYKLIYSKPTGGHCRFNRLHRPHHQRRRARHGGPGRCGAQTLLSPQHQGQLLHQKGAASSDAKRSGFESHLQPADLRCAGWHPAGIWWQQDANGEVLDPYKMLVAELGEDSADDEAEHQPGRRGEQCLFEARV